MFGRFSDHFEVTSPGGVADIAVPSPDTAEPSGFRWLMAKYGGATFAHGFYRLIRPDALLHWNAVVSAAFPEYRQRLFLFWV